MIEHESKRNLECQEWSEFSAYNLKNSKLGGLGPLDPPLVEMTPHDRLSQAGEGEGCISRAPTLDLG